MPGFMRFSNTLLRIFINYIFSLVIGIQGNSLVKNATYARIHAPYFILRKDVEVQKCYMRRVLLVDAHNNKLLPK